MITLPKSLVEIGDAAFSGCTAFANQIMIAPPTVERVGKMALLGTNLKELRTDLPEFVEDSRDGN